MSGQSRARAPISLRLCARMVGPLAICVAMASIAACSDETHSIFRTERLDSGVSLITDAKQRVVINVDDHRPGRDKNHRIICAEPSPDVAQAVSTALRVSANFATSSGASKTDAAAGLAMATAAQVAQLGERLATIQAMRERMYRACEAYANGATSGSQYRNMLSTIDRLMATTLSAEMAAGAFGRNLAVATSQASTGGGDPALIEKLRTELANAAKALEDEAKKPTPDAEAVTAKAKLFREALARMEGAQGVTASGVSPTSQPGVIAGGSRPGDSSAVVAIHRNYLDDDRVESLVDACVSTLADVRYADTDYRQYLDSVARERAKIALAYHRGPTLGELISGTNRPDPLKEEREAALRSYDARTAITREEYLAQRTQFSNYCMAHVFGDAKRTIPRGTPANQVLPGIAPFIVERMRSKERLRQISESATIAHLCFPVLERVRTGATDKDTVAQASYCRGLLKI
jgi:hypothetical protein